MSNPGKEHWQVVKWIMRNVKGTISYGLVYTIKILSEPKLVGYVDANYATDSNRRRSLSRVVFMLFENTVSWKSNLQPVVALSTTETEYMAATEGVKEALWLKELTTELIENLPGCVVVYCYNQSAVYLSRNQTYHERGQNI